MSMNAVKVGTKEVDAANDSAALPQTRRSGGLVSIERRVRIVDARVDCVCGGEENAASVWASTRPELSR